MSDNSQETATLIILRTSDAAKAEIEFSVHKSLHELKLKISANKCFGPIDPAHQRLFHLGRELKSGGRSLKALGVGRFSNFSLHLHSTCPETCDLQDSSDDEVELVVPVPQKRPAKQKQGKNEIIDLLDDDSDNEQEEQGKRQRVS